MKDTAKVAISNIMSATTSPDANTTKKDQNDASPDNKKKGSISASTEEEKEMSSVLIQFSQQQYLQHPDCSKSKDAKSNSTNTESKKQEEKGERNECIIDSTTATTSKNDYGSNGTSKKSGEQRQKSKSGDEEDNEDKSKDDNDNIIREEQNKGRPKDGSNTIIISEEKDLDIIDLCEDSDNIHNDNTTLTKSHKMKTRTSTRIKTKTFLNSDIYFSEVFAAAALGAFEYKNDVKLKQRKKEGICKDKDDGDNGSVTNDDNSPDNAATTITIDDDADSDNDSKDDADATNDSEDEEEELKPTLDLTKPADKDTSTTTNSNSTENIDEEVGESYKLPKLPPSYKLPPKMDLKGKGRTKIRICPSKMSPSQNKQKQPPPRRWRKRRRNCKKQRENVVGPVPIWDYRASLEDSRDYEDDGTSDVLQESKDDFPPIFIDNHSMATTTTAVNGNVKGSITRIVSPEYHDKYNLQIPPFSPPTKDSTTSKTIEYKLLSSDDEVIPPDKSLDSSLQEVNKENSSNNSNSLSQEDKNNDSPPTNNDEKETNEDSSGRSTSTDLLQENKSNAAPSTNNDEKSSNKNGENKDISMTKTLLALGTTDKTAYRTIHASLTLYTIKMGKRGLKSINIPVQVKNATVYKLSVKFKTMIEQWVDDYHRDVHKAIKRRMMLRGWPIKGTMKVAVHDDDGTDTVSNQKNITAVTDDKDSKRNIMKKPTKLLLTSTSVETDDSSEDKKQPQIQQHQHPGTATVEKIKPSCIKETATAQAKDGAKDPPGSPPETQQFVTRMWKQYVAEQEYLLKRKGGNNLDIIKKMFKGRESSKDDRPLEGDQKIWKENGVANHKRSNSVYKGGESCIDKLHGGKKMDKQPHEDRKKRKSKQCVAYRKSSQKTTKEKIYNNKILSTICKGGESSMKDGPTVDEGNDQCEALLTANDADSNTKVQEKKRKKAVRKRRNPTETRKQPTKNGLSRVAVKTVRRKPKRKVDEDSALERGKEEGGEEKEKPNKDEAVKKRRSPTETRKQPTKNGLSRVAVKTVRRKPKRKMDEDSALEREKAISARVIGAPDTRSKRPKLSQFIHHESPTQVLANASPPNRILNSDTSFELLRNSDEIRTITAVRNSLSSASATGGGGGDITATALIPTDDALLAINWAKAFDPGEGAYYYYSLDGRQRSWDSPLLEYATTFEQTPESSLPCETVFPSPGGSNETYLNICHQLQLSQYIHSPQILMDKLVHAFGECWKDVVTNIIVSMSAQQFEQSITPTSHLNISRTTMPYIPSLLGGGHDMIQSTTNNPTQTGNQILDCATIEVLVSLLQRTTCSSEAYAFTNPQGYQLGVRSVPAPSYQTNNFYNGFLR